MAESKVMAERPAGLAVLTAQGQRSFGGEGEEYALEEVLGEGSYGSVYRCLRVRDSAVFAVKIIDTMRIGFVGGQTGVKAAQIMACREVDALRKLSRHPNVISFENAFFSEATQQIFIVTDFVPGSHLFSHIVQRTQPLKESEASHIVAQLADAVSFCHALGIVHRDLKLENVLVANVSIRLIESANPVTGSACWETEELFDIRICDFGFAKSLHAFTTRTPIGTGIYAAPEIDLKREGEVPAAPTEMMMLPPASRGAKSPAPSPSPASPMVNGQYDAFKADAFSVGVMLFVMLCLGFPPKNGDKWSHRTHKLWPTLSAEAQDLLDGLLEPSPVRRLSVWGLVDHPWVKLIPVDPQEDNEQSMQRTKSKESIISSAEAPWSTCRRSPQPRWRPRPLVQHSALPGVLALHSTLVHIQQERAMACWALSGTSGLGGISCWDQLQWHIQLTEKRLHEAKGLLSESACCTQRQLKPLDGLFSHLTNARRLAQGPQAGLQSTGQKLSRADSFDGVFVGYNRACSELIDFVAKALQTGRPGCEGLTAARRYRLFCAAAEQLGRERAFMCGHEDQDWSTAGDCASPQLPPTSTTRPLNRLQRLAEIRGARKVLLGTADSEDDMACAVVATSTGLLGSLVGEDEPSLLSAADIAKLESLERRLLAPSSTDPVPTEEWYQTLTRFLNEIHSRIAVMLVEDLRLSDLDLGRSGEDEDTDGDRPLSLPEKVVRKLSGGGGAVAGQVCGCRAGLKKILLSLANLL